MSIQMLNHNSSASNNIESKKVRMQWLGALAFKLQKSTSFSERSILAIEILFFLIDVEALNSFRWFSFGIGRIAIKQ